MLDVIGVGHACYDSLCKIPKYPEVDTANRILSIDDQAGGAVSQALVTLSRLGASTAYVGNLGDDKAGQYLLNDFKKENVNTDYIKVCHTTVSSTAYILISQETGQRTIFYYPGKIPSLEVDKDMELFIREAKYLHLDATDYVSAVKAAEAARRNHVQVSLDGCEVEQDIQKTIHLISLVDILITNQTFPLLVTGSNNLLDSIRKLGELGPKFVITTCGADGSYYYDGTRMIKYPAYNITPVDTTGAGDSFHGAFMFGLVNHYSTEKCIQFASAVSAINCMTIGGRAGLPSLKQVEDYMDSHSYGEVEIIVK
jgi:sugar/nucleoside kinase (ribokinase family)